MAIFSGIVKNRSAEGIADAEIRLTATRETLQATPSAIAANQATVLWTKEVRGIAGNRWNCYVRHIAPNVAGITYDEFKRWVGIYNPSLVQSGNQFDAKTSYILPMNHGVLPEIRWDRELTNFSGNRWQCWQRLIQGRTIGMTWTSFKREVVLHNPVLKSDSFIFHANKHYHLPVNPDQRYHAIVVRTDRNGYFRLTDMPEGLYSLNINAQGYVRHVQAIQLPSTIEFVIELLPIELPNTSALEGFATTAAATAASGFVQVNGDKFFLRGQPLKRFIGLNFQGLLHYGSGDVAEFGHSSLAHQRKQLELAKSIGARVIRVFLPVKERTAQEIGDRLEKLLVGFLHTDEFRQLLLIPALTNFYHDYEQFVMGDEEFYQNGRLKEAFFKPGGYTENYLDFVRHIVTRFKDEPNIFCWEIGNELKCATNPPAFIQFIRTMANEIKQIDPNHLVTTGMKSTQHTDINKNRPLQIDLYGPASQIDFITVHSYTNNGNEEDADHDRAVFDDINLAKFLGKPLIVEEAGVNRRQLEDGSFDQASRNEKLINHLNTWFAEPNTGGFMQWGVTSDPATGDGNKRNGMRVGDGDFDTIKESYRNRAQEMLAI